MIVATASGQLQRWDEGHATPTWSLALRGRRSGPGSSIALLAQLGDGHILAVERYGRILRIDPNDPSKMVAKTALMAWMRVKVDLSQYDPVKLAEQLMDIDRPSAAAVDSKERLLLTSSHEESAFRVELEDFFKSPESVVPIAEHRRMFFKDNNFVVDTVTGPVSFAKQFILPSEEKGRMNAVAACSDKIFIGTDNGTVVVVPSEGSWESGRTRDLADNGKKPAFLDAGCLADGLAFTIVTPETGRQIELWDRTKGTEVNSVDTDGGAGPLFTFQGVASSDGKRILAISDLGLRVWSIEDRRLKLLGKQTLDNLNNQFSGGALPNGSFVFWDGGRVWMLSADGNTKSQYAGPK